MRNRIHWAIAVAVAVVVCAVTAIVVDRQLSSDDEPAQALQAGDAVVVVESEEAYDRAIGEIYVGTGIAGTLGLVNGKCVGFVQETGPVSERQTVIVWPPGTTVSGSGDQLRITSEGKTVSLGERIDAGADGRRDFPELDSVVPQECRDYPMVPVGLSS